MTVYVGKTPEPFLTMAGLATASKPCQPTNPPPKHYKPPILIKAQQHGNLQQHNINPKIMGPSCSASTQSHVATYSDKSTNTRKPTMTPLLSAHTLCYQKIINNMQPKQFLRDLLSKLITPNKHQTPPVQPTNYLSIATRTLHKQPNKPPSYHPHLPKTISPQKLKTL